MNLPLLVLTFVALVQVVFSLPLKNTSAVRSACKTNGGNEVNKPCVFPFIYKSVEYYGCTKVDSDKYWCYTEVDSNGYGVSGKWGYCNANCNDIPCKGSEVGRVRNNENPRLDELSGLVVSRRYNAPSDFLLYAIEDSGNENVVYVINIDGTLKGQIKLPDHVRNNDFEDIAISTEPNGGYIYVGDIGNDWPGHCPGVDQTFRMVHIFPEPDLKLYSLNDGIIKLESVTTLVLKDSKANCSEESKADSEAMFIDPITRNGYIIQKVRERNNMRSPIIFKFQVPPQEELELWQPQLVRTGYGDNMIMGFEVDLTREGKIPELTMRAMRTNGPESSEGHEFDISSRSFDSSFPAFITAGDISEDGAQIILRGKDEVKIWNRNVNGEQTVEEVLSGSQGPSKTISLCKESGQGESIAFGNNGKGFYTVSEAPDEDEAKEVNVPIFYYSLNTETGGKWIIGKKCPLGYLETFFRGNLGYDVDTAKAECAAGCNTRDDCKFADLYWVNNWQTCYLRSDKCGNFYPHPAYRVYIKA